MLEATCGIAYSAVAQSRCRLLRFIAPTRRIDEGIYSDFNSYCMGTTELRGPHCCALQGDDGFAGQARQSVVRVRKAVPRGRDIVIANAVSCGSSWLIWAGVMRRADSTKSAVL